MERRSFLELAGLAGVVFASGLRGAFASGKGHKSDDFFFLQMSDTHWGFSGPAVNPEAEVTLAKAVEKVNALDVPPDFIVFTGDLTHTTDDPQVRRKRMAEFRDIVGRLRVKDVRFMPGEHDAALDGGAAYREIFGETHYTFDHKGMHFIALDNVSDPSGRLGDVQLAWLRHDLGRRDKDQPIVVLAHRPLFDLAPEWDWATQDGAQAIEALMPHEYVTVFYGHIHQEHHHRTGHIAHHSAQSLIFPLPAPGSVPKKAPIPWDASAPFRGLGFRTVEAAAHGETLSLTEHPLTDPGAGPEGREEQRARIVARTFEYSPSEVTFKRGVPAVLELVSLDRRHGFKVPGLHIREDIVPERSTFVRFTPDNAGRFPFECDVFCGGGHDGMEGVITVAD